MDAILRVEDLHKSFNQLEVLKGISFEVDRGRTIVVMGPSGSGKSTMLRCLNRLMEPDSGRIWLEDVEVTGAKANLNQLRASIGYVFQDFNLFTHLTALHNVSVGLRKVKKMPRQKALERARQALEHVGLADRSDHYPAELSGGQQQRVAIARGLAMEPKVMLFDEPTSALDPELTGEVLAVMDGLAREGLTMLVVSHEVGFARRAADEIIFMENSRIVEHGPPEQLFTRPKEARTAEFLQRIDAIEGPRAGDNAS
jgi:polar amino acid transport system ATP-binding protein